MITALTPEYAKNLLEDLDVGIHPEDAASSLAVWLSEVQGKVRLLERDVPPGGAYDEAKRQYWWGNNELAGFDCGTIDDAVKAVCNYNDLPKGVGSRANRQRFCEDRGINGLICNALNELRGIS